jgi:DNA-directed RNA polymerase subunit M/transcription elongation factor TFIIS
MQNKKDIFKPYITNYKGLVTEINIFVDSYVEINDCDFLRQNIYNDKVSYFTHLFETTELAKKINDESIQINQLLKMKPEELEPELYSHIIRKRELLELKINTSSCSTAFKCKKCGSKKSQVSQKQIRSGDEPATTFITCMECNYTFKF